jgi:hypothetical protein
VSETWECPQCHGAFLPPGAVLFDHDPCRSAARSTPLEYPDLSEVTDRRGKQWKYSEPGDVWKLVDDHLGPGSVAPHSARSYQRLAAEFGPLEPRQ